MSYGLGMTTTTSFLARDLKAARAKARRAFSRIPRFGNGTTISDTPEYRVWIDAEAHCETLRDRIAEARSLVREFDLDLDSAEHIVTQLAADNAAGL